MTDDIDKSQTDLFGEPNIRIKDNVVLERACNRLLLMIQRNPALTDGDSMATIDRTLYAETLWEDGIQHLIPHDKKAEFVRIVIKTQDSEITSRARRYLLEHDLIRVRASAVQSAERFRAKISGAMK